MTVAELIAALAKLPQDAIVAVSSGSANYGAAVHVTSIIEEQEQPVGERRVFRILTDDDPV